MAGFLAESMASGEGPAPARKEARKPLLLKRPASAILPVLAKRPAGQKRNTATVARPDMQSGGSAR
eukprot:7846178-Alexandrium_andersonii.AAC.1